MTKELALSLVGQKGVYLTSEGKRLLEVILKEKIVYEGNEKSKSTYRSTV